MNATKENKSGHRSRAAGRKTRRPLVITRYPGGKRYLRPWIEAHFPKARRFVEGFAGNATVLINRPPVEEEFLIEKNPHHVNLLRVIRDHPGDLIERLRPIQWSENTFGLYKWLLEEDAGTDDVDRAAQYYTVRKMGRGGEGRSYSHIFDRDQQRWWDNGVDNLWAVSERLGGVRILEDDALSRLAALDGPETLFYLDPPYVWSARSPARLYGQYEMDDDAHQSLCRLIRTLEGKVVLSGYFNPIYEEFLGDWRQAYRHTYIYAGKSKSAKGRYKKIERLWMNF